MLRGLPARPQGRARFCARGQSVEGMQRFLLCMKLCAEIMACLACLAGHGEGVDGAAAVAEPGLRNLLAIASMARVCQCSQLFVASPSLITLLRHPYKHIVKYQNSLNLTRTWP